MDRRLIRTIVLAFLLSRGILQLLMVIGSQTAYLRKVHERVWETRIVLQADRFVPELTRVAMVGDAWWYRSIARDGYGARAEAGGTPNWAFFPLYPLLVRALSVTGEFALDGVIVSNLAFACALYLLAALGLRAGLNVEDVERAVVYLAFFPTSYFFSLPMTESLFLALSVGSVLAGMSGRWWLAGVLGGLSAATRLAGVLLIVPLAILFLQRDERPRWKALWLAGVPAGVGVFMGYLSAVAGDPFAFASVQQHWNRGATFFAKPLLQYLVQPQTVSEPWNLLALNFAIAVLLLAVGCAFLISKQWALGAYTLLSVLLPLSSGSLQSIARYGLVVFPLFFWLAVAGRRAAVDRVVMACSVAFWGWLVAMLTLGVDYSIN